MANSKLPHERLRDWADIADRKGTFPSTLMDQELGEGFGEDLKHCDSVAFRKLADEIERYYIARPRYEDGEPVQFGDEVESESGKPFNVDSMVFDYSCSGVVGLQGEDARGIDRILCLSPHQRVKRPAPNVLDADGMHIWVGDYVWFKGGERSVSLPSALFKKLTVDAITDEWVKVRTESGGVAYPHPKQLTHREHDSLRKLRDDMTMYRADMTEEGSVLDVEIGEWTDRLTALMERGAE